MAYNAIEMPEPFRSDWRFAFGIYIMIKLLGKKTGGMSVQKIYTQMRKFFDTLPEDRDALKVELQLKGWLKSIGARQVKGAMGDLLSEYIDEESSLDD